MAALTPVLFVIDNLEYGGGERGFLQLVRALGAGGWTVAVAAQAGGPFEREARAAGARFVPLDMRRGRVLWTAVRLRRLVRRGAFGLVHSQGARADFLTRVALLGLGGVKNVCTVQMPVEGFDVGAVRRRLYLALDRLSGRRVDRYIAVSQALRRALVEGRGLPAERVTLVYNGVETEAAPASPSMSVAVRAEAGSGEASASMTVAVRAEAGSGEASASMTEVVRRAVRQELGLAGDELLVGALGRLVWQKGFADLIRALPVIRARRPRTRLVIAGDGPLREELAATARALGVGDRFVLAGFRGDVPRLLAALDVLVVPSRREGFPMITLEAMALGVAIVATAIDGIVEQIEHGVHGLLVPPGDVPALGAAIVSLLEDPDRRQRLGQAARQRAVAVFDVRRTVAETTAIYTELLHAAAGVRELAR